MDKQQLFHKQVAEFVNGGWMVVAQTQDTVMLESPKRWDLLALFIGVLTLPTGFGVFILGYAIVRRFFVDSHPRVYLTADDVAAGLVPDFNEMTKMYYEKSSFWHGVLIVSLVLAILFMLFIIAVVLVGSV